MLFWAWCSKPLSAYLNPTKCLKPTSSVYTQLWKVWLRSISSIGGAGGGPNMAFCVENTISSAEMPFWGLCSNPQPTNLNPTKCFKPTSSVYTQLWKLWLASKVLIGGAGGRLEMGLGLRACQVLGRRHLSQTHNLSHLLWLPQPIVHPRTLKHVRRHPYMPYMMPYMISYRTTSPQKIIF